MASCAGCGCGCVSLARGWSTGRRPPRSHYQHGRRGTWGEHVDCLWLRPHIWTYRTVDEASDHWLRMYGHLIRYGEDGSSLVRVMNLHSVAVAAAAEIRWFVSV
ncbi:hypothetical protein DAI22_12g055350 [Oryza sativa Japonica Group]|nr:uncharacterized protein LOC107278661 [Oryza sativa Japonica Group]KAF2906901.1 hypothetical protein DAI22_12g055350 [Oryza sativa Japonica Group]